MSATDIKTCELCGRNYYFHCDHGVRAMPIISEKPFWMVFSPDVPPDHYELNYRCPKQEAINIAVREARTNPGKRFYVLAAEFVAFLPKQDVLTRDFIQEPIGG